MPTRTISLQVPPNATAGDALAFCVGGQEMEIPVPEGSQPGDVLEIQVNVDGDEEEKAGATDAEDTVVVMNLLPESTEDEDALKVVFSKYPPADGIFYGPTDDQLPEDEEGRDEWVYQTIMTDGVPLCYRLPMSSLLVPSGEKLRFDTVLPPAGDGNKEKKTEGISPSGIDDGTHAHPWPAGMVMGKYWGLPQAKVLVQSLCSATKDSKKNIRVLELGSGLGLVGIAFGVQYPGMENGSMPKLSQLVLSDVQDGMALLEHNLQQNKSSLPSSTIAKATPLLWTVEASDDNHIQKEKAFDLVLASDVIYNTESIPALVATLKRYLQSSASHLLFAARWRKPEFERAFFEALEGYQGKHWKMVHSPSSCPHSWKDYGNPNCEASNKYFHQTMVSVQGKPHSLAQIMADDKLQEQMMDPEADAFENCHIQIYCLTSINLDSATKNVTDEEHKGRKRPQQDGNN